MEEYPICPDWWPKILWNMHFQKWPKFPLGGPSPINYPVAIDHIMAALMAHTSSYLLQDKVAAHTIRQASVKTIVEMAGKMDRLHDEAMKVKV